MEKTTESLYRISARSTNHRTQDNSKQYPLLLASLQHYLAEGFLQLSAEVLYLHTLTEINVPCFVPFCPTKLFSERLQTSLKSGLILTIISLKPRLYHVIHLKELLFSVSNRSSNSPFQLQFLETTQKQVFWLTIFFLKPLNRIYFTALTETRLRVDCSSLAHKCGSRGQVGDTSLSKDLPYHLLPDSTQKKKKRAVDLTTAFKVLQITYNLPGKVNKDLLLDLV